MDVIRTVQGGLQRNASGWTDSFEFYVCGIGGDPNTRRLRAMDAAGVPKYGSSHPDGLPGIKATNITSSYIEGDPDQVVVSVEFTGDPVLDVPDVLDSMPGFEGTGIKSIEVSTSSITQVTTRDYTGRDMIVTYRGAQVTIPGVNGGIFSASTPAQVVTSVVSSRLAAAEYDLSTITVVVTIEKPYPSHAESRAKAMKTNSAKWSGLDAYEWLFLGVDSSTNQNGKFDWRYILSIAPNMPENKTWQFRSENSGDLQVREPRTNIDSSGNTTTTALLPIRFDNKLHNGIEFFHVYEPANFQQLLGFSIPF